jgi:hypothetical protein
MRFRISSIAIVFLVASAIPAVAQANRDRTTTGFSIGTLVLPDEDISLAVVGVQLTRLNGKGAGVELGIHTVPSAIMEGIVVIAPSVNVLGAIHTGDVWLTIKGGATLPMALNEAGAALVLFQGGIGAILPASEKFSLRMELQQYVLPMWFTESFRYPIRHFSIGLTTRPGAGS